VKTVKMLSWLVAVAGLWEALAPFILGYSAIAVAMWNAVIIGLVLFVLAVVAARNDDARLDKNLDWVNVGLGVWLVLAPFILGYSATAIAMWNDIVVGIVVVVLAIWAVINLGNLLAAEQA
jgi:hypothetical protein